MITLIYQSLWKLEVDAYVNPVNCEGVSGAGLAKAFATRYPAADQTYRQACRAGSVRPGVIVTHAYAEGPTIYHFPTKVRWKERSSIDWIEMGLKALRRELEALPPRTDGLLYRVACPLLGCGLGGLDAQAVRVAVFANMRHIPEVNFMLVMMHGYTKAGS